MNNSALEQLLAGLDQNERQEFQDAVDYLTEMSGRGKVPEGSIARILNQLSPNVRDAFGTLSELLDTPRTAPFQPKMAQGDYADVLGLDRGTTAVLKQRLEDEDLTASLQARMGTDRDMPQPDLTRREQIAAALEAHQGGN